VLDDADIERRSVDDLLAMVLGRTRVELLERAGGLERLARSDAFEIAAHLEGRDIDALTPERGRRPSPVMLRWGRAIAAAFELGRRVEIERAKLPDKLAGASDVAAWATPRLAALAHEELWMLGLDGRGALRAARCVAKGGLHGAGVRAADPLRAALRVDASGFVLVHNHPSGDPTPSKEDVVLTEQVGNAAAAVGLALLDHVVVARGGFACVPWLGPTLRNLKDRADTTIKESARANARGGAKEPKPANPILKPVPPDRP
jgi:DNA repair protein RadC